jgi:C-1 hydroxylase
MEVTASDTASLNKRLIREFVETWNQGDLRALSDFWSPELVHHARFCNHGRDDVLGITAAFMGAFPDLLFAIEDLVAEGEKVVVRLTVRGTHQDTFLGIPATGREVTCSLIQIVRIKNGKIVEHWGLTDELLLMEQIGLVPTEYLVAMS